MGKVYAELTFNLSAKVRRATWNGRRYLVASMSSIVPGVLNGSKGSLLYPPAEIKKSEPAWDGIPIMVNHPIVNGQHVSASHPAVQTSKIGFLTNTKFGTKLHHEGWFDEEKTKNTDVRVYNALISGRPMELSTGLYTFNEMAPAGATYNGQSYNYIARHYRPDHMAILPDQIGACSINDGCGLHVNSEGLSGGKWVTTESGNRLYIKDGEPIAGNPHVISSTTGKSADGNTTTGATLAGEKEISSLGFKTNGLDKVDPRTVHLLHEELKAAKAEFPGIEKAIDSITVGKLPAGVPATLQVEFGSTKLLLDPSQTHDKTEAAATKSQKSGWLASAGGVQGLMAHEIAHAIDKAPFSISQEWGGRASKAKLYIKSNPPTAKDLSRYATAAGPHQKEEMFAEAYAAYRTKSTPSSWQKGFNAAISGRVANQRQSIMKRSTLWQQLGQLLGVTTNGGPGSGRHASGTSQEQADKKSKNAESASKYASKIGDKYSHNGAAIQHQLAADAQRSAGNETKAAYHDQKAAEHKGLTSNGGPGSGRKGHTTKEVQDKEGYTLGHDVVNPKGETVDFYEHKADAEHKAKSLDATRNANQPRHPKTKKFQGLPHAAAKRGFTGTLGQPIVPDKPDDEDAALTPDDHDPASLIKNDGDEPSTDAVMLGNNMDPHQMTKQAAGQSMDLPAAREPAVAAVDASNAGDQAGAAKNHLAAAKVHDKAANQAFAAKNLDDAQGHLQAASAHRQAAGMQQAAVANSGMMCPDCNSRLGGGGICAKCSKVTGNQHKGTPMAMTREQVLEKLTANCSCDQDKAAFNSMSDETLLALNAGGDGIPFTKKVADPKTAGAVSKKETMEDGKDPNADDDDDAPTAKGAFTGNRQQQQKPQRMQDLLANASQEDRDTWENAVAITRNEQSQLINRLVVNVVDANTKKRLVENLGKKSLPELRDMVAMLPAQVNNRGQQQQPAQRPTLYIGANAPTDNAGGDSAADDLLDLPVMNWDEEPQGVRKKA